LRLGFEPELIRRRLGALSALELDEPAGEAYPGD